MTKEEIEAKLKAKRISYGMTQQEVADKIGRKQPIVGHWETGYSQPDENTLFILCDLYGTTVDDVFGFKKEHPSLSKRDKEVLKKYNNLDSFGKETIDIALDRETERVTSLKKQKERIEELETTTASTIIDIQPRLENNTRFIEYHHSASAGTGVFILGSEGVDQLPIPDTQENRKVDYAIKVSGNSMEPDYNDGDIVLVSQKVELNHGDVGIFIINNDAYIKEYGETELISRNPDADNIIISEYDNIVCMGKVVGKYQK